MHHNGPSQTHEKRRRRRRRRRRRGGSGTHLLFVRFRHGIAFGRRFEEKRVVQIARGVLLRHTQSVEIPKRTLHKVVGRHFRKTNGQGTSEQPTIASHSQRVVVAYPISKRMARNSARTFSRGCRQPLHATQHTAHSTQSRAGRAQHHQTQQRTAHCAERSRVRAYVTGSWPLAKKLYCLNSTFSQPSLVTHNHGVWLDSAPHHKQHERAESDPCSSSSVRSVCGFLRSAANFSPFVTVCVE